MLKWTQDMSVNVAEIDEQHKNLLARIKWLDEAIRSGQTSESLGPYFNSLLELAAAHFSTEEKLMEQHGFPGFIQHRNDHTNIARQAEEFKERSLNAKGVLSTGVLTFLGDWLINHILKTDKEYSKFLNDKGVC